MALHMDSLQLTRQNVRWFSVNIIIWNAILVNFLPSMAFRAEFLTVHETKRSLAPCKHYRINSS